MRKMKAFTIIEILITMLIMGTMSATLIPRIGDAKEKANDTLDKINTNRSAACGVDGLEDLCVDNGSSNGGVGTQIREDGIYYEGTDITVCGTEYISDSNGAKGCITIQDRNLGASTTGAGPSAPSTSYGNFYKWGDNTNYTQQNWIGATIQPNNAWGGGDDNNGVVYPVTNESERRGPCDEGYHVPSKWEWYALMDMWAGSSTNGRLSSNLSQFYTDFQIPFAGQRRSTNGEHYGQGISAKIWSSSPGTSDTYGRNFYIYSSVYITYVHRAFGFPIRCFKN